MSAKKAEKGKKKLKMAAVMMGEEARNLKAETKAAVAAAARVGKERTQTLRRSTRPSKPVKRY